MKEGYENMAMGALRSACDLLDTQTERKTVSMLNTLRVVVMVATAITEAILLLSQELRRSRGE